MRRALVPMVLLAIVVGACGGGTTSTTRTTSLIPLDVAQALTQPDGEVRVEGYFYLAPAESDCEAGTADCPVTFVEHLCYALSVVDPPTCVGASFALEGVGSKAPTVTYGPDALTAWTENQVLVIGVKHGRTITVESLQPR